MKKIQKKSLATRLVIGKLLGIVFGVIFMCVFVHMNNEVLSYQSFGMLILFILLGVTSGFMGIYTRHPLFGFKLPWWLRGAVVGLSFTLVLVLLDYAHFVSLMNHEIFVSLGFESPFWVLVDGAIIGMIIDFVQTKIAGEGKELLS